jgi:hypothetical protein
LPGKPTLYGRVLKSVAYVALIRKAADKTIITIILKSFNVKKTNDF